MFQNIRFFCLLAAGQPQIHVIMTFVRLSLSAIAYNFTDVFTSTNINILSIFLPTSNLSGAKSSKVNGSTPNVTRWKKNGKYIDICGSKNIGKIISYGRQ